ncbi:eCIS core domain-containing protein [Streptomyces buecherae]|uniref:eCIS core domain-containing protein n=1 Tax=Streptomyces buecherae TaxID=2763006 RepID=UPI00366136C6
MRRHEHDHEQHEHEHHETGGRDAAAEAHERARTPHVLRAAVAGRTDVLGRAGMATLQRAVGNSAARTLVQRRATGENEATEATEESVEQPRSSVHDVVSSGGGQALDPETRTDMETRLGADFSDVRVHTDAAAHDSAKEVGAHAYTVGNNVVFQRDAYDTSSRQGRTMLAHELTHVVQQRSGPVDGAEAPGGIRVSDPGDRFEQEAASTAERVMAEPPAPTPQPAESAAPQPAAAPAAPAAVQLSAAPAVQRAAEEGEDEEPADVQGAFVQRAERKPEEEEEETPPE